MATDSIHKPRRPMRQGDPRLARHLAPPTARELAARKAAASPAPSGRVYGYCRVSTGQQADEGESLDVQQRTIAGYAQMRGLVIEHVFVERGVSGSRPLDERPQGSELIAALRPGDIVVAPKLDRMFRSALDALQTLQKMKGANISVHLLDLGGDVTDNGVAKAFFTMASAFAELERDRTKERITEVKADQRKRGRYLGGTVPFGFRPGEDGNLVPVPEQQKAIETMRRLRAQGLALRVIADKLKAAGTPISHQGVKKVLLAAARRTAP
jgi:putative DNA-invertase from lambdoid prophage Rac